MVALKGLKSNYLNINKLYYLSFLWNDKSYWIFDKYLVFTCKYYEFTIVFYWIFVRFNIIYVVISIIIYKTSSLNVYLLYWKHFYIL